MDVHTHILTYLLTYLPTYLPAYLPACLPTYLIAKPGLPTWPQKGTYVLVDVHTYVP